MGLIAHPVNLQMVAAMENVILNDTAMANNVFQKPLDPYFWVKIHYSERPSTNRPQMIAAPIFII